ncbi:phage-shock protein [Lentilactobacillus otakiensis]|uniref:phage-shock protein n=1 Tax=Lentilactobacillus otakiensis TaxID=481720 RepID=UPI003D184623
MTFNWKYAVFTNAPLFVLLLISEFMAKLKLDPIWLLFAIFPIWAAWYVYADVKIYDKHPEFNYLNRRRGIASWLIATIAVAGFSFLILKFQWNTNMTIFIAWLAVSNFLIDGFTRSKGIHSV